MADPSFPVISPSSVADLDCPKKFWITRVLRQWPPRPHNLPNTAAEFGTAFHEVMRGLYDPKNLIQSESPVQSENLVQKPAPDPSNSFGEHMYDYPQQSNPNAADAAGGNAQTGTWIPVPVWTPDMTHLEALTRAAFHARRYPTRAGREEDILRCARAARTYVLNDDEQDVAGTLVVERWGDFLIHQGGQPLFRLEAKLDRVLVRAEEPGRLVVRDYKTSRSRRVNLAEAFVVLWVARLCFPGYEQYTLEYDRVDAEGFVERDVVEGSDLRGQHGLLLLRLQSVLAGEDHEPVPGDLCAFCPLRPECQPLMDISALTGAFL